MRREIGAQSIFDWRPKVPIGEPDQLISFLGTVGYPDNRTGNPLNPLRMDSVAKRVNGIIREHNPSLTSARSKFTDDTVTVLGARYAVRVTWMEETLAARLTTLLNIEFGDQVDGDQSSWKPRFVRSLMASSIEGTVGVFVDELEHDSGLKLHTYRIEEREKEVASAGEPLVRIADSVRIARQLGLLSLSD